MAAGYLFITKLHVFDAAIFRFETMKRTHSPIELIIKLANLKYPYERVRKMGHHYKSNKKMVFGWFVYCSRIQSQHKILPSTILQTVRLMIKKFNKSFVNRHVSSIKLLVVTFATSLQFVASKKNGVLCYM